MGGGGIWFMRIRIIRIYNFVKHLLNLLNTSVGELLQP